VSVSQKCRACWLPGCGGRSSSLISRQIHLSTVSENDVATLQSLREFFCNALLFSLSREGIEPSTRRLRAGHLNPSQLHNALLCLTVPYYVYFYHLHNLFSSALWCYFMAYGTLPCFIMRIFWQKFGKINKLLCLFTFINFNILDTLPAKEKFYGLYNLSYYDINNYLPTFCSASDMHQAVHYKGVSGHQAGRYQVQQLVSERCQEFLCYILQFYC